MKNIEKIIQSKSHSHLETIYKMKEKGFALHKFTVGVDAQPCELNEDSEFFVLTGNRNKPEGIGSENPPDLCYIYNQKYGLFVETESVRKFIKENRKSLKVGINESYNAMGVLIPLGAFSTSFDEDFLTALPPFSEHDS